MKKLENSEQDAIREGFPSKALRLVLSGFAVLFLVVIGTAFSFAVDAPYHRMLINFWLR